MTQAEMVRWLLESTCASSAAIVLVLLLRRPLRAMSGANVAYLLWLLLPLSVLAASLPARVIRVAARETAGSVGIGGVAAAVPATVVDTAAAWLLSAWVVGVVVFLCWQVAAQRRFRRSLGAMRVDQDGHLRAQASAGLPAVVGLRARIVLPADFEARYDADERALILAHERIHLARRDVLGNALLAALRCVYWFNPLAWIAAERFRRDQELACDEAVIASHPRARRAYGQAMVKTQLSAMPAPLACHWFGGHPLKERIAMLKRPVPGSRRVLIGVGVAAVVAAGASYAVWMTRPATKIVAAGDAATPAAADAAAGGQEPAAVADAAASVDIQSKNMTPPKYPADAVANRITGKVVLLIDVAADGSVANAQVEKSEPAGVFDQVTLDAAKAWKFQPAIVDGKPAAGRVRVPVDFAMDAGNDAAPQPKPAGGNA